MPNITSFKIQYDSVSLNPTNAPADVTADKKNKRISIRTSGSGLRQNKGKCSQVTVFTADSARQLFDLLKETFGFN